MDSAPEIIGSMQLGGDATVVRMPLLPGQPSQLQQHGYCLNYNADSSICLSPLDNQILQQMLSRKRVLAQTGSLAMQASAMSATAAAHPTLLDAQHCSALRAV
jgi:hypothetical protein